MESSSPFQTLFQQAVRGGSIRLEAVSGLGPGPYYPGMAIPEAWAYFRRLAISDTQAAHLESIMMTSALLQADLENPKRMHADARRMIGKWVAQQRAALQQTVQEKWRGMTLAEIQKSSSSDELSMRQVHTNIANCHNSARWKILHHVDLQLISDVASPSSSLVPLPFPELDSRHLSPVSQAQ